VPPALRGVVGGRVTASVDVLALLPPDQVDYFPQVFSREEEDGIALHARDVVLLLQAVPDKALLVDSVEKVHVVTAALEKATAAKKALERIRDAHVRPLNAEVQDVNRVFNTLYELINQRRDVVQEIGKLWRRKEQADRQAEQERLRKIEEEAAEREAEARARAAAAQVPELKAEAEREASEAMQTQLHAEIARPREVPKTFKSANGGSTSFREVFELKAIAKYEDVPEQYKRAAPVMEALKKVLQAAIRGGVRSIPGCEIGVEEKLAVRG
jgi:hypothetical protein